MLRLPVIAAAALSAAAATCALAQGDQRAAARAPGDYPPLTDIAWSYAALAGDDRGGRYIQFARKGMSTTTEADELPEVARALADASSEAGTSASFDIVREAGVIACTGAFTERGSAAGTCRFDPDTGFVAALAERGLVPEDVEELLGLAFVDARLASIEDLARAGFVIAEVDELMTVAALEVTGAYAVELREAGLQPEDIDELVSAKAVGVDSAWIAEMAEAGFAGMETDRAIELRALDVTPDYARRMARVMRATDGVE